MGVYPYVPLSDARKKAREFKVLLAAEIDPQTHRNEQRRILKIAHLNNLELVATKWLSLKQPKISDSYHKKIASRLKLHVYPKAGQVPLHKLNAVDMIDVLKPLEQQGKLETINNICGWLNEIMTYSANTGLIHANPLAGISKAFSLPKTTHLPTLKPDELPELMAALRVASINIVTKNLIEFQLQTMVRPAEASGTRWEEIDFDDAIWTIPAERMKTSRAHVVPLSPQVVALLVDLKPIAGHREHVFPARRSPRKPMNSQTANMALKRMGFAGRLVSHGMRALASTTLNEEGFDADVIESALAHVDQNSVRAAYNRAEYLDRRREMMTWWSGHIEHASEGNLSLANASSDG
jgi:integrase